VLQRYLIWAVPHSIPKSFLDLNLKAFGKGLEYGAIALSAPASFAAAELKMEYATRVRSSPLHSSVFGVA